MAGVASVSEHDDYRQRGVIPRSSVLSELLAAGLRVISNGLPDREAVRVPG
jgi:hypothetical protein